MTAKTAKSDEILESIYGDLGLVTDEDKLVRSIQYSINCQQLKDTARFRRLGHYHGTAGRGGFKKICQRGLL